MCGPESACTVCTPPTPALQVPVSLERFFFSWKGIFCCLLTHGSNDRRLCRWFFAAMLLQVVLDVCLFIGTPQNSNFQYVFLPCISVSAAIWGAFIPCYWRRGHQFRTSRTYKIAFPVYLILKFTYTLLGFFCPLEDVPFLNPLWYTAVIALSIAAVSSVVVLMPTVIPPEPRKTLVSAAFQAGVSLIKQLDCLTDYSFLRIILQLVCFSQPLQIFSHVLYVWMVVLWLIWTWSKAVSQPQK